jgi:hypothetical protein
MRPSFQLIGSRVEARRVSSCGATELNLYSPALSVSMVHAAATTALVEGIAGMMFFTTPCVYGRAKTSVYCMA